MTVMNQGRRWGVAALTLLVGACSSGRSSAPSNPAPPSPAQASAAPTASVAPAAAAFCNAVEAEFALVPQLLDPATERDSTRRRALLAQAKQANNRIVANAPEEQRDDVRIVIGASNAANAALVTSTTVPPAVMKQFDSPEYRAASARVRTYIQDECHIEVPDVTGEPQSSPQPRAATEPARSPRSKG